MRCDFQRSKCYAWEQDMVHRHDKSHVPFDQLQVLVDYVWNAEGLQYPPKVLTIDPRNTRAIAKADRLNIWAPPEGLATSILLHELAHSLTSEAKGGSHLHGPVFVGAFIHLLSTYAGFSRSVLTASAISYGVDFNMKRRNIHG